MSSFLFPDNETECPRARGGDEHGVIFPRLPLALTGPSAWIPFERLQAAAAKEGCVGDNEKQTSTREVKFSITGL